MAESNRYVDVAGPAIFHWLSQPTRSPERDLLESLLAVDPTKPLDLERIAGNLQVPVSAIARTLFALNRQQSLAIATSAPPAAEYHRLASNLRHTLDTLGQAGMRIVLAADDGLLLAYTGCEFACAERVAAGMGEKEGFGQIAHLSFWRVSIRIYAVEPLDRKHRAWVTLARLLQKTLGSLSFGICP